MKSKLVETKSNVKQSLNTIIKTVENIVRFVEGVSVLGLGLYGLYAARTDTFSVVWQNYALLAGGSVVVLRGAWLLGGYFKTR